MTTLQPFTTEPQGFTIALPIRRALEGLALALNHSLEPEQLRVYAFALADVPSDDLRAACVSCAKTERFWPKPIEIRTRAAAIARDKAQAHASAVLALAASTTEPTYRCSLCLDDPCGWQVARRCPDTPCDRRGVHGPHTFVVRCVCWLERNASWIDQRRQEALQGTGAVPPECYALSDLREGRYRWAKPY